jgi:hypothetical protein
MFPVAEEKSLAGLLDGDRNLVWLQPAGFDEQLG